MKDSVPRLRSSGDWAHTQAMLREFQPQGFDAFAGSETFLLQTMRSGGAGADFEADGFTLPNAATLAGTD
jgi:hypothetical protein